MPSQAPAPTQCMCCISVNKQLLLNVDRFLEVMVDSLLLDPEHPRAAQPDFDTIKVPIQRVRHVATLLLTFAPELSCYCYSFRTSPRRSSSLPCFHQDENLCSQMQPSRKHSRRLRSVAGARTRECAREGRSWQCPIMPRAPVLWTKKIYTSCSVVSIQPGVSSHGWHRSRMERSFGQHSRGQLGDVESRFSYVILFVLSQINGMCKT